MTTETLLTAPDPAPAADAAPPAGADANAQAQGQQGDQQQGDQPPPPPVTPTAPEKYEFKAPEGRQYDTAVLGAYSEVAKELNLPQDAAQKVIDKVAPVLEARQAEIMARARTEWGTAVIADKEFGGGRLIENLAVAKKGLEAFGTPDLMALLGESGLGNHPEVIRAFYRVGKAIGEDKFVGGKSAPQAGKSPAESLYSKQNQQV